MSVKEREHPLSEHEKIVLQEAEEYGIDLSILEENLSLTPTQRLEKLRARLLFSDEITKTRTKKLSSAIQETLYLLSIPGMRESIRTGLKTPVEKCSEKPGW